MSHLRAAVADLRYRWPGLRIGGPHATMRGQWVVVSAATLFVFACFFAIGRLQHGGGAAPAVAPSAQIVPGSGAVPTGLSGGSPTAGTALVAIALKPQAQPAPATTEPSAPAATAQPYVAEAAHATVPTAETPVASVPTVESSPAPAASEAPAHSRRRGGAAAGRHRKPRGGSHSSPAVTFDSSE